MKTGLTKQEKTTVIWFNKKAPVIHIQTHNTDLKKRLAVYAGQHPGECRQTNHHTEMGCMEFKITKRHLSFRLTAHTARNGVKQPEICEGEQRRRQAEMKQASYFCLTNQCGSVIMKSTSYTLKRRNYAKTKVKELHTQLKLTQQQLADLVHVSSRTIISIEKEQYSQSLMLAYRMAEVFGVTVEELCCLKENRELEDKQYEDL